MNRTITKNGIVLLPSVTLVDIVERAEKMFPGCWWSLSQTPRRVTLSVGPSVDSSDWEEVLFSQTRIGDQGFTYSALMTEYTKNSHITFWAYSVLDLIYVIRDHTDTEDEASKTRPERKAYRRQDRTALESLKTQYGYFESHVATVEDYGHLISELYLGSCTLSADCSIRGTRKDGKEFDISMDLQGESTVSEALWWATQELLNDITTSNLALSEG